MRRGRGKAKGGSFEREIAKKLSLWWTKQQRDDVFWRSHGSGGRATVRGQKSQSTHGQYGDLASPDPIGQILLDFTIFELKVGYGKTCIFDILDNARPSAVPVFEKWIAQAALSQHDANSYTWTIIHKRKGRQAILYMPDYGVDALRNAGMKRPCTMLTMHTHVDGKIISFPLTDWFLCVTPKVIKRAWSWKR